MIWGNRNARHSCSSTLGCQLRTNGEPPKKRHIQHDGEGDRYINKMGNDSATSVTENEHLVDDIREQ
jgi:hypothetical protein